jgi:hypothetical protein
MVLSGGLYMDNNKLLRRRDLVWREVDGETVIISPDNKHLQVLDDVGSRIWALLDGEHDVSGIAATICSEYEGPKDSIEKDIVEYLEHLKRLNLVEE